VRRQTIVDIVAIEMEWLDGSFVTLKNAPGDIDVVTFITYENMAALRVEDRQAVRELTEGPGPRQVGCDSFLVIVFPHNHAMRPAYERMRGYWDDWWSHRRLGAEKGYVDVRGQP
jgi:hypothetical protein